MANFLLIDTAASVGLVALTDERQTLALVKMKEQNNQAAEINIAIQEVLEQSGLTLSEISCLGVCAGPGSYTGLRVGMSTAKGIAFSLHKPLICFDRLQLIANSKRREVQQIGAAKTGVLLKARNGECFWALFDEKGNTLEEPEHLFEADVAKRIKPEYLLISDCSELSFDNKIIILDADFCPDLSEWLKMAVSEWNKKNFADIAYSEPFYLKKAYTTSPKK